MTLRGFLACYLAAVAAVAAAGSGAYHALRQEAPAPVVVAVAEQTPEIVPSVPASPTPVAVATPAPPAVA